MISMNYQDLYYFVKVVEKGSLVAAAEKLDVPTSTLSRRMAALEENIGYQLLHRTSRSFGLTDAGSKFYERLQRSFNEIEFESQNVISELTGLSGDLTVTAPLALGRQVISKWVFEFMQQNPNISIELLLSNQPIDLVKKGVDIALRVGEIGMADWVVRPLGIVSYSLVASSKFLSVNPTPQIPKDLESTPTITISTSPLWRLEGPEGQVTVNPHRHFRCDVVTACLEAATHDMGVALLPHFLVRPYLQNGILREVLPRWVASPKQLRMFYPKRDHMPAKNRAFINFIIEKAEEISHGTSEYIL